MKPAAVLLASAALATAKPTVYFIRHGEKPADGSTGLSPQGQQRAQCLRGVFGASSQYNIGYIMAETPSKGIPWNSVHIYNDLLTLLQDGSHDRPYETVAPLAADLGITVDTSCDEKDAKCVKKAVEKYSGPGNILIAYGLTR